MTNDIISSKGEKKRYKEPANRQSQSVTSENHQQSGAGVQAGGPMTNMQNLKQNQNTLRKSFLS